jgi:hypothetical protein
MSREKPEKKSEAEPEPEIWHSRELTAKVIDLEKRIVALEKKVK